MLAKELSAVRRRALLPRLELRRRQLETRELKAGGHRAADECPGAEAGGLLPRASRHNGLRAIAGGKIGAEPYTVAADAVGNRERQRRSCVPVPGLGRIDPVPT